MILPLQYFIPVVATDVLKVGPALGGILGAADGIGAFVGAIIIGGRSRYTFHGRYFVIGRAGRGYWRRGGCMVALVRGVLPGSAVRRHGPIGIQRHAEHHPVAVVAGRNAGPHHGIPGLGERPRAIWLAALRSAPLPRRSPSHSPSASTPASASCSCSRLSCSPRWSGVLWRHTAAPRPPTQHATAQILRQQSPDANAQHSGAGHPPGPEFPVSVGGPGGSTRSPGAWNCWYWATLSWNSLARRSRWV